MTTLNLEGLDTTGIELRKKSMRITFPYLGKRCKESLNITLTRENVKYAIRKRAAIMLEIEKDMFDYAAHFPNSKYAKQFSDQSAVLVKDMLINWLATKKDTTEHSTYYNYERIIYGHLIPLFGDRYIDTIESEEISEWLTGLNKEPKTQRNYLSPFRQAYDYAIDQKKTYGITENPTAAVKIKVERKRGATRQHLDVDKEINPFTPDEIAKLLKQARNPLIYNYILFNVWTGLRPSEMLALAWEDIDLDRRTIRIRRARVLGRWKGPKTMKGNRTIKMLSGAEQALRALKSLTFMREPILIEYHDEQTETLRPVFINPTSDLPWYEPGQFRDAFAALCRAAGVTYRIPKQLRHTYASWMLSANENPMWVADQMGHEDWGLVRLVYGKYIPAVDPHAGEKAEALYKGPRDVLAKIS